MQRYSGRATAWRRLRHRAVSVLGRVGAHRVAERLTGNVPRILMFHRFSVLPAWRKTSLAALTTTLDAVSREYRAISLDDSIDRLERGLTSPRDVVLTVDDAYEDFHRIALPEFERRALPVTLYIPTDFVDGRAWLWPDRLLWLIRSAPRDVVELDGLGQQSLRTLSDRRLAWNRIAELLVDQSQVNRERLLDQIERALGLRTPSLPTDDYRPMSWDQVRDAAGRGVCIASQAGAHVPLSRESAETQFDEARRSKSKLECEVGREARHFSYPHGRLEDFNRFTMDAARRAGYVSAAGAVPEAGPADAFALPRVSVPDSVADLRSVMSGMSQLWAWAGK